MSDLPLLRLDDGKFDGFIFDLDGTLADSMPLHFAAWTRMLEGTDGKPTRFTEELFYSKGGTPPKEIVHWLNEEHGYELNPDLHVEEKEGYFVELLEHVRPIEPVVDEAHRLRRLGKKMAVASGGPTDVVTDTLRKLDILPLFDTVVGSDQVERGKPAPDTFLLAAERLEVAPEKCLVLEDATPGFVAAEAAGMEVIDVKPYYRSARPA